MPEPNDEQGILRSGPFSRRAGRSPGGRTITTTVAIRSRAGHATVWLEITYQGLAPPTDLFADLTLVGWSPPPAAPPPHEAIDWSRPNEETGERFTLRDYTVPNAVVAAPAGTGVRGAWTDAERTSHLAALARVLDRHPDVEVDDPAALVRGAALPPPPPPVAAATLPPPPAPAPAPAASFVPSPGAAAVLITAPLKPSLAPRVEDELVALGVTAVFDNQERVRTDRYRGATYQTTVTELHVAVVASPEQMPAVTALLTGFGLALTYAELDDAAVGARPDPEPEPSAGPMRVTTARDVALARVVALAEPRFGGALSELLRTLGLADARVTPSTRIEVSQYRGSTSEREVPTLLVEAWVPEPDAPIVATRVAEIANLRRDDAERLWIEPAATTGPAPGADSVGEDAPAASPATPAAAAAPPPAPAPEHRPPPPPGASSAGRLGAPMASAFEGRALVRRPVAALSDHGR